MARSHATIYASAWSVESDFRDLPIDAQWLYLALLAQPDLNLCGVMPFIPSRWSRFAPDLSAERVEHIVAVLVEADKVVVDDDTVELWVRSFMFHDRVFAQPQVAMAAAKAFGQVQSPLLRDLIHASVPPGVREGWPECLRQGSRNDAKALLEGCSAAEYKPSVRANGRVPEGSGSGSGSGLGSGSSFPCSTNADSILSQERVTGGSLR